MGGGAGSPLRHGCLSGKAMLSAGSRRLDAVHLFNQKVVDM